MTMIWVPRRELAGEFPEFAAAQRAGRWDFHATEALTDARVLIVGYGGRAPVRGALREQVCRYRDGERLRNVIEGLH